MEGALAQSKEGPVRGRGAASNPVNRFEALEYERDYDSDPDLEPAPITQFLKDTSRSIVARNESPDVGFEASINPYRACEHGCVYCYARPTHEYLGMSAGLDFETRILVKENAPELLRAALAARSWKPQPLAFSGVTDCYQPAERKLRITRRCLEVLCEFRNPAMIITKNRLITRDIDLLQELARYNAISTAISVTTLDRTLQRELEPRASTPENRLKAIRELADSGIPVSVMIGPVIPGLTEHEIPAILKSAADAGATGASYIVLRLPFAVKHIFDQWLDDHRPLAKEKVLNAVRALRSGGLNDPRFQSRMRGEGPIADSIQQLFEISKRHAGLNRPRPSLSTAAFRLPGPQLSLWD